MKIKRNHKKPKEYLIPCCLILIGLMIALNIISRLSTPFCDFYLKYITPVWSNTFIRIPSVIPFSVSEILILLAFIAVIFAAVFLIISAVKNSNFKERLRAIGKIGLVAMTYIIITSTLGSTILYHCSTLAVKMELPQREFSKQELSEMYDDMVEKANVLAETVTRDENGLFHMDNKTLNKECRAAVGGLADELQEFKGYIPKAKPMTASWILGITSTAGIFYPFAYECNFNNDMPSINKPSTICHELAHSKGIMLEDEANFIGYYACINSDNVNMQYAGYVNLIEEIYVKIYNTENENWTDSWGKLLATDIVSDFEYWRQVMVDNPLPANAAQKIDDFSNTITDSALVMNGVSDGIKSYGRVIDLALAQYYYGE